MARFEIVQLCLMCLSEIAPMLFELKRFNTYFLCLLQFKFCPTNTCNSVINRICNKSKNV